MGLSHQYAPHHAGHLHHLKVYIMHERKQSNNEEKRTLVFEGGDGSKSTH